MNRPPAAVPEIFDIFPLPQAIARNAQARAKLRAEGIKEREIQIGEGVGAFETESDGYWFGKSFYNAEAETGRGDIGFLRKDGEYTMLDLAELRQWSVSALTADTELVQAGLMHRGEAGDRPGGLLSYDRSSKRVAIQNGPAVIHTIVRVGTQTFVGTTNGPYLVKAGTVFRLVWR